MNTLSFDKNIFNVYSLDEMASFLSNAGFLDVQIQEKEGIPFTSYCIIGTKI